MFILENVIQTIYKKQNQFNKMMEQITKNVNAREYGLKNNGKKIIAG